MRADSGFYAQALVAVCREMDVRFSITIRHHIARGTLLDGRRPLPEGDGGAVRYAGARGQPTVRADSGFYAQALVAVCREMDVRFSITIRQHARLRNIIEAIPEADWTPIPYWMDGAPPMWRRPATSPFRVSPTPHRCGSSPGG